MSLAGLLGVFSLPLSVSIADGKTAPTIQVMQVLFEQGEAGIESYVSRLLASEQFLRFDDGADDGDFVLFDRRNREVHNFNHEDRSHIVIKPQTQNEITFEMDYRVEKKSLTDAPKITGEIPVEHRFYADDRLCRTSINVQGLLPDLRRAMIDFETVIAAQGHQTLDRLPAAMKTGCFMANNYLKVSNYLEPGFPILLNDDQGRYKRLLSFETIEKPLQLFQQPPDYRVFYPTLSK